MLDCEQGRVKVHYEGWPKRFDHWISSGSDSVRVDIKKAVDGAGKASAPGPKTSYCLCNQPFDSRPMIACDSCNEWYHTACVCVLPDVAASVSNQGTLPTENLLEDTDGLLLRPPPTPPQV